MREKLRVLLDSLLLWRARECGKLRNCHRRNWLSHRGLGLTTARVELRNRPRALRKKDYRLNSPRFGSSGGYLFRERRLRTRTHARRPNINASAIAATNKPTASLGRNPRIQPPKNCLTSQTTPVRRSQISAFRPTATRRRSTACGDRLHP